MPGKETMDMEESYDPITLMRENALLRVKVKTLSKWVSDLQSGTSMNCAYCGHRYGPNPGTPFTTVDILREHIARCSEHPLNAVIRYCEYLELIIIKLRRRILGLKEDMPDKDSNRAEGGMPCGACRRPLSQHFQPLPETCPAMVEDCMGNWWKT